MKTIRELYTNVPIQVVVDFHIQSDKKIQELEGKIHAGDLSVINELEQRVADIINNEIEEFDSFDFESSYLKRIKMLVRTKQILSSRDGFDY
jgi:hypothetical protein